MTISELTLSRFVVNKVWEIIQTCVDESRKGWFVTMPEFRDAMGSQNFDGKEVREALEFLEARTYLILFPDADGHVARISLVPQRYQCGHCRMWLNMQDDPEGHIDLCLKQQKKIEMSRKLV